jgi:ferric-dicitrate binding protein FerR (iron transport regulator)
MKTLIWAVLVAWSMTGLATGRSIHQLEASETLKDVAASFLGSADAVGELASYNKLLSPDDVGAGDTVAIPGEERRAAIDSMRWGGVEVQRAKAIGAKTYAKPELEWAEATLEMADSARQDGAYTQAVNLAKLAAMRALRTQDLTNGRAPVQQDAIVTGSSGKVEVSATGESWQTGTSVPAFGFIRTAPGARAIVKLPDNSVAHLRESSLLQLAYAWVDRRDGNRETVLRLLGGNMRLHFAQPEVETSSFRIEAGVSEVSLSQPATIRLAVDGVNRVRLSTLEGSCSLDSGAANRELEAGYGILVPVGREALPPRKLLAPPASAIPANSAQQLFQANWQLSEAVRCAFDTHAPRAHSRYHFELAHDADFLQIIRETFPVGSSQNVGLLQPGTYHWRLASIDGDGVEGDGSTGVVTITPNLDVAILVDSTPADEMPNGRVQVHGGNALRAIPERADSNVVAIEYSVDGAAFVIMDNAIQLGEGEHELRVRGIGPSGERGAYRSLSLSVDASGPAVTSSASKTDSLLFGPRSQIRLSANAPDVARIEYSVNGRDFASYSGPFYVPPSSRVQARAVDSLGNTSATITVPTN